MQAALDRFPQADSPLGFMAELNWIRVQLRKHSIEIARECRAREKAVLFLLQELSQTDVMQSWVVKPPLACRDYLFDQLFAYIRRWFKWHLD
jgi:hypothetical protein